MTMPDDVAKSVEKVALSLLVLPEKARKVQLAQLKEKYPATYAAVIAKLKELRDV